MDLLLSSHCTAAAESVGELSSWAAQAEEEDWKAKHDKTKLDKMDIQVEDVITASASDDGMIRLWQPIQVQRKNALRLPIK